MRAQLLSDACRRTNSFLPLSRNIRQDIKGVLTFQHFAICQWATRRPAGTFFVRVRSSSNKYDVVVHHQCCVVASIQAETGSICSHNLQLDLCTTSYWRNESKKSRAVAKRCRSSILCFRHISQAALPGLRGSAAHALEGKRRRVRNVKFDCLPSGSFGMEQAPRGNVSTSNFGSGQ